MLSLSSSIKKKQQTCRKAQTESKCHENFHVLTIWELDREGRQRPPEQKAGKMWQDHMHVWASTPVHVSYFGSAVSF